MKEIQLTKGFVTQIDDEDYELVAQYKWHISSKDKGRAFSVQAFIKGKNVYLHRFIMKPAPNLVVDHIDRNPLNNQRSNLRICTRSQNQMNKIQKPKSSIYKGVSKSKSGKPFRVYIKVNRKHMSVGSFDTEIEAALAYNEAAIKHHGEFAYLNQIDLKKSA